MDIAKLLEQRKTKLDEAEAIAAKADAEGRGLTEDEQKAFDAAMAAADDLEARVGTARTLEERRGRLAGLSQPQPRRTAPSRVGADAGDGSDTGDGIRSDRDKQEYHNAWCKWFRHGLGELQPEERDCLRMGFSRVEGRAVTTATSGAGGGYTVPQGFLDLLQQALRQEVGVLQAGATVIETDSGNPFMMPTVDDTSELDTDIKAEAAAVTNDGGNDPAFNRKQLGSYTIATEIVKLSVELAQDSAFDIGTWLGSALATRVGRKVNYYATVGTGSSQPLGVATASVVGKTAASQTAITYDELVDLEHSVDPAYRADPSFGFMCHDQVLAYLRKIKDGDGRPILDRDFTGVAGTNVTGADGTPAPAVYRLLGRPLYVNNRMASTLAASNRTLLCGAFSYYWARFVRPRMVVVRFGEKFMDELNVGYLAYTRFDGIIHDPAASNAYRPIKHLAQAAAG